MNLIPAITINQSDAPLTKADRNYLSDVGEHAMALERQVNDLREQLAAAHEAIGAALALLRQQQYDAAQVVLDDALKGRGP